MGETAEKSQAWRWVEGVILTVGLTIPCIILLRAFFDSILPAMVAGFALAVFAAWCNV